MLMKLKTINTYFPLISFLTNIIISIVFKGRQMETENTRPDINQEITARQRNVFKTPHDIQMLCQRTSTKDR